MSNNIKFASENKSLQEKAMLIWNTAENLLGAFKSCEYGLIILPMVVIKRFHDCLRSSHQSVLDTCKKLKNAAGKDDVLQKVTGYPFYNMSLFTFETLRTDPKNIGDNFRVYLDGFSDNVKDILSHMNFAKQIDRVEEAGLLYQLINDFCSDEADMSPENISAFEMGYVFENLVKRFMESCDEDAGVHFTGRDIVHLMCDLLVRGEKRDGSIKTVYDMTMGTGQMLTCMEEHLKRLDAEAEVAVFGQELNSFVCGLAKANMLIRSGNPDNMRFGNTLSDDQFGSELFDFCISNPPFGVDWKREASKVDAECKKEGGGRFGPGLPNKNDAQMLFLLNGLSKLKSDGRMAIIQNASSMFIGDAGSGPSEIRRYLIENDLLEAIVQLPADSFYNTSLTTYIWILTKNKVKERTGRVQLIDASKCFEARWKRIGNKRVDISEEARKLIIQAYDQFCDKVYEADVNDKTHLICKSKVLDNISFGYSKIIVESPMLRADGSKVTLMRGKLVADASKRDSENVPLNEGIDDYFAREVLSYNPDAWIDKRKTRVGYEISFTRTFYEYKEIEPASQIAKRIEEHERSLIQKLHALFGEVGE